MSKRTDIHKILVIGSGPIVIGQAAEFDYAGTQACIALKEEGYEVILVNSNPATIMTDTQMADKVYMEPLTLEYIAKIIRYERPDAIVPGLGGQTGLNLAVQLVKKGILKECDVEILGTPFESIEEAEDRELFKKMCESIGEPVIQSGIANSIDKGLAVAKEIGYPVVLRPAFTLGGTGGGFAYNEDEFKELMHNALIISPVHQVLIEKSVKGFKEIEYEVMRDADDSAIAVCDMENIDPVGIHTGDSMVVCPIQTLSESLKGKLKHSAIKIIRRLKIEGGCNVQFAVNPDNEDYYLIEVNPRVSRSSALASKASGFPIARVTAKIAIGMKLSEIPVGGGYADNEPVVKYNVTKIARFPFDKFTDAKNTLGTQMKATGEVMSLGIGIEESLLKGMRSLETGVCHIYNKKFDNWTEDKLLQYIMKDTDDRIFAIAQLLRMNIPVEVLSSATKINKFFIGKLSNVIYYENLLKRNIGSIEILKHAKKIGISDKYIGQCWNKSESDIFMMRKENNIMPVYKMVDGCKGASKKYLPYFYSTYNGDSNESKISNNKKIIVLGSGPIRIGQGIEFDYSTVHAVWSIQKYGYEAIIINNNPETVSTDYTTSDKLYFEPLTVEDVMNIITLEKPSGVIVTLGGQTAINLAKSLKDLGAPIIGTDVQAIENAENRDAFEKILNSLNIPRPRGKAVINIDDGISAANEIGYPVLVRPSYVLGGRAMQIVNNAESLRYYLTNAVKIDEKQPVLIDKYISGKELEVDAVCDGNDVFIPGIMEHIEHTGVHSGDSISVYPTFSVSDNVRKKIIKYTVMLGKAIGIVGLYNIQFIADENDEVYIIEVNPRSSRTVPFISKSTGFSLADIGTLVMLGHSLKEQGFWSTYPLTDKDRWYVKAPAFSFNKLSGMDAYLSPEMKSTGEAIGYDDKLTRAVYKALKSSGMDLVNYGTLLCTIADADKERALPLIRRFYNLGFNIEATEGTAIYLKEHGIKTKMRHKLTEENKELFEALSQGHISYVINTTDINQTQTTRDGYAIRRCAVDNNVALFSSLDTVGIVLDVLEEITLRISTINEK
ncbi:MAG: hypothetical protein [Wendovervirus sonii]|uniref:Carbamoyl-phosphate synthase (glutamine-hydrolyzing) n=1 Tax=phage Lak_Megaphage_Sonny TaxID=3109229 RepID=A0ABZ0Z2T8_9CAUD|nr:MAG: hypothetical protein [phage Lak_Megaphage_Sonny]